MLVKEHVKNGLPWSGCVTAERQYQPNQRNVKIKCLFGSLWSFCVDRSFDCWTRNRTKSISLEVLKSDRYLGTPPAPPAPGRVVTMCRGEENAGSTQGRDQKGSVCLSVASDAGPDPRARPAEIRVLDLPTRRWARTAQPALDCTAQLF